MEETICKMQLLKLQLMEMEARMESYTAEIQDNKDDTYDAITKIMTDINSASSSKRSHHEDGSHKNPSSTSTE